MASVLDFSDSDKSDFGGFNDMDVSSTEKRMTPVLDSLESVQSIDLDSEPENHSIDNSSDNTSMNEINNLLEDIEHLSEPDADAWSEDEPEGNLGNFPQNLQGRADSDTNSDSDSELCIDLDNLADNPQNGDELYDVLRNGPEWTNNFQRIHVNQFNWPTGPNLTVALQHLWIISICL